MHPGQLKPRTHLALSVVILDRSSHSSGTQFLHGTDARVEMEDLQRSTHFPQTQQFYNPMLRGGETLFKTLCTGAAALRVQTRSLMRAICEKKSDKASYCPNCHHHVTRHSLLGL